MSHKTIILVLAQISITLFFKHLHFFFICMYGSLLKTKWSEESDSAFLNEDCMPMLV